MKIWQEGVPKGTYVRLIKIFEGGISLVAVDETGKNLKGGQLVGINNGELIICSFVDKEIAKELGLVLDPTKEYEIKTRTPSDMMKLLEELLK